NNIITFVYNNNNDVLIQSYLMNHQDTSFQLSIDKQTYRIPLLGKHHAQNATYAIVLGKNLGIDRQAIHKALMEIELTSMRFEMMKGNYGVSVINDAYNA